MSEDGSLLEFPCDFPIKIMGIHSEEFVQRMVEIVQRHAADFRSEQVAIRPSSGGKYLAVTCTIRAISRQQLDALYHELSTHPTVKVVL